MKACIHGLATALLVLGAACGGGEGDDGGDGNGNGNADGGGDLDGGENGGGDATGTITGSVESSGGPLEGATVSILGADLQTETDSSGTYSLEVPVGAVDLLVEGEDHWGALLRVGVTEGQTSTVDWELATSAEVSEVAAALDRTIDPAEGMVEVFFVDYSGGESASLSEGSDPPFLFDENGDPVEGSTLEATSDDAIIFTGVPTGTVQVTVTGGDCEPEFPDYDWPVRAQTITSTEVHCGEMPGGGS